jgi:hypothetical protein
MQTQSQSQSHSQFPVSSASASASTAEGGTDLYAQLAPLVQAFANEQESLSQLEAYVDSTLGQVKRDYALRLQQLEGDVNYLEAKRLITNSKQTTSELAGHIAQLLQQYGMADQPLEVGNKCFTFEMKSGTRLPFNKGNLSQWSREFFSNDPTAHELFMAFVESKRTSVPPFPSYKCTTSGTTAASASASAFASTSNK